MEIARNRVRPRRNAAIASLLLASCIAPSPPALAQDLLLLAGITDPDDSDIDSYDWRIEVSERFTRLLGGSVAWINEGHVPGHHRDGAALQLWARSPPRGRLELAVGAGPYFYFDTVPSTTSVRGFSDQHGVGAVFSAAASYRVHGSWSVHLNLSDIQTPGNSDTHAVLLGAAYRFGERGQVPAHRVTGAAGEIPRGELQFFGAKMIANSLSTAESRTVGLDYRRALARWAAWSTTWYYRVDGQNGQHNRIAAQLWLVNPKVLHRVSLSAGLGAYTRLGPRHVVTSDPPDSVEGLFGLRADFAWSPRLRTILAGYRRFTSDDRDSDILTLGLGWRL